MVTMQAWESLEAYEASRSIVRNTSNIRDIFMKIYPLLSETHITEILEEANWILASLVLRTWSHSQYDFASLAGDKQIIGGLRVIQAKRVGYKRFHWRILFDNELRHFWQSRLAEGPRAKYR